MKYRCPCCGFYTYTEKPAGNYAICPVCFWEDDPFAYETPHGAGSANGVSLHQAQSNYRAYGACHPDRLPHVRPPWPEERTGEPTPTLLLIDGHNLLFQMFFGMPSRITNRAGVGIWGVIGFIGALRKIIAQTNPTHMAVLFDGEHANDRRAVNPDYKSTRVDYSAVPEEDSPFTQLPHIQRALEHLRIPYAETTDCEVDDWMAAYARRYGGRCRLVLSSFDSDFFQLISPTVSVLRYRGESSVLCDEAYLREKYGVTPGQYADFKSLTGDTADDIRGADKIGPKTAAALLREYGTLEGILTHAESIPRRAVRESVLRDQARLRANYRIIHLDGGAAIPMEMEELGYTAGAFTTNAVLGAIGLLP